MSYPPSERPAAEAAEVAEVRPQLDDIRRERTRAALLRIATKHRDLLRDLAK